MDYDCVSFIKINHLSRNFDFNFSEFINILQNRTFVPTSKAWPNRKINRNSPQKNASDLLISHFYERFNSEYGYSI